MLRSWHAKSKPAEFCIPKVNTNKSPFLTHVTFWGLNLQILGRADAGETAAVWDNNQTARKRNGGEECNLYHSDQAVNILWGWAGWVAGVQV